MKKQRGKERITTTVAKKIFTAIIVIVILSLQLWLSFELSFGIYFFTPTSPYYQAINICMLIIACIYVARIYNKNVNISYKLTWTILILVFPLFGTFCYTLYGNGHSMPKRKNKKILSALLNNIPHNNIKETIKETDRLGFNLLTGLEKSTGFPCYNNTKTKFFKDASLKHQSMIEDIKNAKKYVFLEYFIISDGELLEEVYDVLNEVGQRGVNIYFIYDDVGSKATLKEKTIKKFKEIPNLKMQAYAPFGKNLNPAINYRDHRKIVVVDGQLAYCGGDNLADEYIHKKIRFGYWRDNSIKIQGDAVEGFVLLFLEMWYMSCKEMLKVDNFYKPQENEKIESIVMPFGDGPTYKRDPSYSLFLNMIASAQETIYISTPYFIIDKDFINTICRAIRNGVEVVLLVPHIPDKKSVFYMTRGHYGDILKAGGKIYEYSPGFNHAKNLIVDSKYAFIGTTNFDYRSFFLHFECGVFLVNDSSIKDMEEDFLNALEKSELISVDYWKNRPFIQKAIEFALSFFSPLL